MTRFDELRHVATTKIKYEEFDVILLEMVNLHLVNHPHDEGGCKLTVVDAGSGEKHGQEQTREAIYTREAICWHERGVNWLM